MTSSGSSPGSSGSRPGTPRSPAGARSGPPAAPGFTIYATILGSPTRGERNADLADLLAFGLSRYRLVPVIAAERTYATARLPYGRDPVALVAARPAKRPVRLARALVERVVAPTSIVLPVRKGQRVGEVRVYDRGKLVASSPLVASRSVELPGRVDKVGWYAKRTLHHLGGLFS